MRESETFECGNGCTYCYYYNGIVNNYEDEMKCSACDWDHMLVEDDEGAGCNP